MPQNLFNDKKEDIYGKKNSAKASELQLRNEPTTLQTLVGCSVTTVEIQWCIATTLNRVCILNFPALNYLISPDWPKVCDSFPTLFSHNFMLDYEFNRVTYKKCYVSCAKHVFFLNSFTHENVDHLKMFFRLK